MLIITNRFDLRNLPPACTVKVSVVSIDVATMLLENENNVVCSFSDIPVIDTMKQELKIKELLMDNMKRKVVKGDKLLHVSYYRPKTELGTGKTEYRMITVV